MTRNTQDIIDDMRNIVKPRIANMLLEANFEGCGKDDKAEFETEFEMILTLAEIGLKFSQNKAESAEWVNNKCSTCSKGIEDLIDSREWYENEKPNYCPFCGKKFKKSEK